MHLVFHAPITANANCELLRCFVVLTSVSVPGAFRVLKRVKAMGKGVSRLHTIWTDQGNDCEAFMIWVMDVCR